MKNIVHKNKIIDYSVTLLTVILVQDIKVFQIINSQFLKNFSSSKMTKLNWFGEESSEH